MDRTHAEVGDGAGVVRGAFSYVDPRQQVRTVEYVADEQGNTNTHHKYRISYNNERNYF